MTSQPLLFDLSRPRTTWRPPTELPDLSRYKHLWCDTESDGLDPRQSKAIGQSVTGEDDRGWYLPWGHKGGGNLDEAKVKAWTVSPQGLAGKHLHFLNAKHDHHMFLNAGIDLEAVGCQLHDVSFQAALLDDNRGYGGLDLHSLLQEYCGLAKDQLGPVVDKSRMAETHSSEVGAYAEGDARKLKMLWHQTQPKIEAQGLTTVLGLEDRLIYAVARMERHGLRIDHEKAQRWLTEIGMRYGDIILEIWQLTGVRVNPNAGKTLVPLFKKLGIAMDEAELTATGDVSFTEEILDAIPHPVIKLVSRARRLNSLRSRYLKKFVAGHGHLYYALHQLKGNEYGTVSGRFSGTNMSQQIMKVARQREKLGDEYIIRELVVPEAGKLCLAADARQIEPRLFVHYAQCLGTNQARDLLAAYQKNPLADFYDFAQGTMNNIPSLQAMVAKIKRMYIKVGTLGKFYGLSSAVSAAVQLKCTEQEASAFMREYDQAFPVVRQLMNRCIHVVEERGYIKTVLDRRARLKKGGKAYVMMNRLMQGTAADVNKVKLYELDRERKTLGIDPLRLTLHDEFVGDIDPDPMYKARTQELLDTQSLPQLWVPILWETNTGINWKECA